MYTTPWCGYCRRLKGQLSRAGITFAEVDIERDPSAADTVARINDGNQTVPTLVFADGSALTNPSVAQVQIWALSGVEVRRGVCPIGRFTSFNPALLACTGCKICQETPSPISVM